jgi:hypothetical protein
MISPYVEESTCPSCGARVIVARATDGKRVAMNPLPSKDGYWYFGSKGLVGLERGKQAPEGLPLFVDHAQTCPQKELFS